MDIVFGSRLLISYSARPAGGREPDAQTPAETGENRDAEDPEEPEGDRSAETPEEERETPEPSDTDGVTRTLTAEERDYTVVATVPAEAGLSGEARLRVKQIQTNTKQYRARLKETREKLAGNWRTPRKPERRRRSPASTASASLTSPLPRRARRWSPRPRSPWRSS